MDTPILFLVFNRPQLTIRVFEAIRKAEPPKLFIMADGPRPGIPEDISKCLETRKILNRVDWECEVKTLFFEDNRGCGRAVVEGINWFFYNVEQGIILEDDCLPHPTFFRFCEELLDKYRDDERIAMISGDNFQFGRKRTEYSYYFSRYTHIWGWASWRRAWDNYDVDMKIWPEIRDGGWLEDLLGAKKSVWYWKYIFENVYKGKIDTWDYQWTFSCWIQSALTVLPNVNLVSNIGFGSEAVHTTEKNKFSNMKTEPIIFPISHPPYILRDSVADNITEKTNFSGQLLKKGIIEIIKIIRDTFK